MQTNHRTEHSEYSACDSLVTQTSKAQITLVLGWLSEQRRLDGECYGLIAK